MVMKIETKDGRVRIGHHVWVPSDGLNPGRVARVQGISPDDTRLLVMFETGALRDIPARREG